MNRICGLALSIVLSALGPAVADNAFPSKPVRVIDAYAAGGSSDLAMRMLTDAFSRALGQPVYIESKPGAGGLVGTAAFLNAPADGYSLLIASNAILVVLPAAKTVPYDPETDFIPIGLIWHTPQVLAVKPELKVSSLADFVALAKSNPAGITMGSAGIGTVTHLSIELLRRETKVPITHVPYRGTGNSLAAVLGNQIDGLFGDVTMLAPSVASSNVRGLAITGKERSSLLPGLPTAGEGGLPGLGTTTWFGLVAPAKTPPAIVAKLRAALAAAQTERTYRESVSAKGIAIQNWDADSFATLIKQDRAKWTPIIRDAGIKID